VAIVAGGTVITGAHGASGEIGYNLRTAADVGIVEAERRSSRSRQRSALEATAANG